jgi:transposase-like protein
MDCVACGSAGVTERPERTTQGYRRFRCRSWGKQYNGHSGTLLNHAQYPSDVKTLYSFRNQMRFGSATPCPLSSSVSKLSE